MANSTLTPPRSDRDADRSPDRDPDIQPAKGSGLNAGQQAQFDQLESSFNNPRDFYAGADAGDNQVSDEAASEEQAESDELQAAHPNPGNYYDQEDGDKESSVHKEVSKREQSLYKGSNKAKKAGRRNTVVTASVMGGLASAVLGAMALFFLFSFLYKPQHIREYLLDVHFARFNRAITRRTGQLLTSEAIKSADSTARLVSVRSGGVVERIRGFNPQDALDRLGREKGVTMHFEGGQTWSTRGENTFRGITIKGDKSIPLRPGATLQEQAEFMAKVSLIVDETFALENKFFRGKLVAEIRDLAGIKLSKWPGKGKEFDELVDEKAAKIKAQQETIDEVLPDESIRSASPEVDEATDQIRTYLNDGTAAEEIVENPNETFSTRVANLTKARPYYQVMRGISIVDQVFTFFCLAYEAYVQNIEKIVESRTFAYQRSAVTAFSMADQQKAGDGTTRAVQASVAQYDNFEESGEYRRGQGLPVNPDNDLPVDQQPQKALGESPAAIKSLLEDNTPGGKVLSEACPVILSAVGQATIALTEAAMAVITAGIAEGGAQAGFQVVKNGLVKLFTTRAGAFQAVGRLGAQVSITIFLTDAFVPHLAETYSGGDVTVASNGIQNFNQAGVGTDLFQAQTLQTLTGNPLTSDQVAALNQDLNTYETEKNRNRSFYARILDPNNVHSLTAQALVSMPTGSASLKSDVSSFLATINPFNFAKQKIAQITEKSQPVWAAIGEDPYGIQQFGVPLDLLNLCDTDRSYCPRENALIVEPALNDGSLDSYEKCTDKDAMNKMVTNPADYSSCFNDIENNDMAKRFVLYNVDKEVLENFKYLGNDENDSGLSSGGSSGGGTSVAGLECPSNLGSPDPNRFNYYDLPLPAEGEAYNDYGRSPATRNTGSRELICAIYTVGKAYKQAYGPGSVMQVGDLNASGHQSHKWGVAVDTWGGGDKCAGSWDANEANPGIACSTNYDEQATIDFGKMWVDTGIVKNIWWCPPDAKLDGQDQGASQIAIRDYAQSKGTPITIKCISSDDENGDGIVQPDEIDHADHFHVDILDGFRGPEYAPE